MARRGLAQRYLDGHVRGVHLLRPQFWDANLTLKQVQSPFALPRLPSSLTVQYPEDIDVTNANEALSAASARATPTAVSPSSSSAYIQTQSTPRPRNFHYALYIIGNVQANLVVYAVSLNV